MAGSTATTSDGVGPIRLASRSHLPNRGAIARSFASKLRLYIVRTEVRRIDPAITSQPAACGSGFDPPSSRTVITKSVSKWGNPFRIVATSSLTRFMVIANAGRSSARYASRLPRPFISGWARVSPTSSRRPADPRTHLCAATPMDHVAEASAQRVRDDLRRPVPCRRKTTDGNRGNAKRDRPVGRAGPEGPSLPVGGCCGRMRPALALLAVGCGGEVAADVL